MQHAWIEAGYIIVSDALAPGRDGVRGPQRIVTMSTCIVDSYPDGWALPWTNISDAELDEHRASLGLGALEFAALRAWVSDAIDDGRFGWTNTFLSLDAARDFNRRFLGAVGTRKLLGASFAPDIAAQFLREEAPQRPGAGSGVWTALSRNRGIELGGKSLGFDVVGADWDSFHTFWCNGLQRDFAAELGLQVNRHGLFDEESQARAACEFASRPETGAEPCAWYPVRIDEHDFNVQR